MKRISITIMLMVVILTSQGQTILFSPGGNVDDSGNNNVEITTNSDPTLTIEDSSDPGGDKTELERGSIDFDWSGETAGNFPALGGSIELRSTNSAGSKSAFIFTTNTNSTTPSEAFRIGTSVPELDGSSPASIRVSAMRGSSTWSLGADITALDFFSSDGSGAGAGVRSSIRMFTEDVIGSKFGLRFMTDDGAGTQEVVRVTSAGHMGIGTASPVDGYDLTLNSGTLHLGTSGNQEIKFGGGGNLAFKDGSNNTLLGITDNGSTASFYFEGDIGIGIAPTEKLTVGGKIRCEEVKVEAVNPPDYVFAPDYDLRSLEETSAYIAENQHLPEIPSAKEMEANGIDLGVMNMKLLQKIEELTLYLIEQRKEIDQLKEQVENLENH